MTKPSSRSSVARALFRAAPLALMLLAAFGLFVSGCGDDSPTTPTPTPTPTPAPPTPEPPAVPTGLQVASTGPDYIEWSWTAVEGATGYDIQMSLTEGDFSNSQLTQVDAETTSRRFTVAAETTAYARVRAKNADGESDWSTAVSGTSMAAPIVLTMPANLRVTDTEPRSITWAWNAVVGASEYVVQMSLGDAQFTPPDRTANPAATAAPQISFEVSPETVAYVRVRAVAGAGAERVEGPWALAVRGESEELPLTAPAGLEVSGRSTNYIEWSWDAVAGVTSYDAQISLEDDNFSPPSSTFNGLTRTTHRVPNLDPNDVVYLRVRAVIGTRQSVWSAPVRGQTEPPPIVPLTTPAGFAASGATRNTVSLDWNDVTDAEYYEVEQRAAGGAWGDATCRVTDDNEPSTSACVATGLEAGTEYGFRVRAIPADDAALQSESEWSSTASATTTGRQSVGGGGGALNIRWRSTASSITWNWTPTGTDYERKILEGVQLRDAPCDTPGRNDPMFASSYTLGGLSASDTRLLCVRTLETDNAGKETRGDWSYSWAVARPPDPGLPAGGGTDDGVRFEEGDGAAAKGGVTSKLKYTVMFSNQPEFDYEFGFEIDEEEKTNDNYRAPASGNPAAQRRCQSMTVKDTASPGGTSAPTTYETNIDLVPYATYRMCYRALNDEGASEWAYNFGGVRYTRPLAPSVQSTGVQTNTGTDGETSGTGNFRLSWSVSTPVDAPEADNTESGINADYGFRLVHTAGSTAATADDVQAVCESETITGLTPVTNNIIVRPQSRAGRRFDIWRTFPDTTPLRHYYLCVQTKDSRNATVGGGTSPWAASAGRSHGTR